ncbi:MAG: amino acid adenylation domain-containing protein, partial [Chloroflexi bacterium]|nr:amino acid adenylation domain-containing protein [Chloroflexota bacterium]
QTDFAVGSPIANRQKVELEPLIGFFVNTLVLRANLAGAPTVRELLARVRDTTLAAYAHQDVPFEELVQAIQPARDLSRNPLFQVMFVLQNTPLAAVELPAVTLTPVPVDPGIARFDLTLALTETDTGLHAALEYNTAVFTAETAGRLLSQYQAILEHCCAMPDQPITAIPLLSADERQLLLSQGSATVAPYPEERALHELFTAQAQRTPDAIAVVFEAGTRERVTLTYGALNQRANQLAHHLRSLGVGDHTRGRRAETLVGVCLDRSLDLVVALLAVLKAGGAYLPLDPSYPAERLMYMLADAGTRIVVTTAALADRLAPGDVQLVRVDVDAETIAAAPVDAPAVAVPSDGLAYVIYTSGSTGRPKGVQISHANVLRLMHATDAWFGFGPTDVWTLFHSYAFDFSVWELWGALLYGGRLVVVPFFVSRSPEAFRRLLASERVTVLNQTPSAFRQLMRADEEAAARDEQAALALRYVILGGEALDPTMLRGWVVRHGIDTPQLVNMYGITETSVHVTYHVITVDDVRGTSSSPIGVQIPDLSLHVLDARGHLVPPGVPGELHVGGAGIARGYLGQPSLTAERFVPDPFSGIPGARMYRSGDLARRMYDGRLEYRGRLDSQVKLRGFRIELGEIEATLRTHPGVVDAVVLVRGAGDERRLVAWFVATDLVSQAELRTHVATYLPAYMVPAAFVKIDTLPLTPNGKVDQHALPTPTAIDRQHDAALVAPRTPTEAQLTAIWQELLDRQQIGIHDSFFDLGGHSLLATQVMSRLRDVFQVELPIRQLFQTPTVAELAAIIEAQRERLGAPPMPPIRRAERAGPLPLSFAQQRLWFLDQLQPNSALYNIPVAAQLSGPLDVFALEASLNTIVQRHESLRTTFAQIEDQAVQIIVPTLSLTLPVLDLSALPADERQLQMNRTTQAEAAQPFVLSRPPLIRCRLLRLAVDEHVLLVTLHHIVSDGWSMDVLVRELAAIYGATVRGATPQLDPLPVQYADYAIWQREWLAGAPLEAQLAYWRRQLAGVPALIELPTDRPRPVIQTFRGAQLPFIVPARRTAALRQLSRQTDTTLFMLLLAAFQTLLFRYSGQTDIVVGTPIAGRTRREIEGLIGFFVNTLVLRAPLDGNPRFGDLLARTREITLGAYAHQDLPFEQLVEALDVPRSLSYTPLFQVMFVLQNVPRHALDLGELTLTPLPTESATAKFDLTFVLSEEADQLSGAIEYSTDLFDAATIARMAAHFQTLLEGIVVDPSCPLGDLPLLCLAERRRMLVEWNATTQPQSHVALIHALFAEQATRTPATIAMVWRDEAMTYAELDARTNQLAHHLRQAGVSRGVRVGVCMERSQAALLALLGIIKAGGTFVPLDSTYPLTRLVHMAVDSQTTLLLVTAASLPIASALVEQLPF